MSMYLYASISLYLRSCIQISIERERDRGYSTKHIYIISHVCAAPRRLACTPEAKAKHFEADALSHSLALSLSLSGFFGSSLLLSKDEARIAG